MVVRVNKLQLTAIGTVPASTVVPAPLESNLPTFYRNNWRDGVSLTTAWLTDVTNTPSESRVGLRRRPTRLVETTLTALRHSDTGALLQSIAQGAVYNSVVPLYCDRTSLTADVLAGGSKFLPCDTQNRRFHLGQRIIVARRSAKLGGFGATEILYSSVLDVQPDGILVPSSLGIDMPKHSYVFPAVDGWATGMQEFSVDRRDIIEARVSYAERSGQSTLPALTRDLQVHSDGLPIFDVGEQNGRATIDSVHEEVQSGRELYVHVPRKVTEYRATTDYSFHDRASYWNLLTFFNSVGGRRDPFWTLSPANMFRFVSRPTSTSVVVTASGYSQSVPSTIGLMTKNRTRYVRAVDSVDDNGATWTLHFTGAVPSDVFRATSAHKVRFAFDALREDWSTNKIVSASVTTKELPFEQDVSII